MNIIKSGDRDGYSYEGYKKYGLRAYEIKKGDIITLLSPLTQIDAEIKLRKYLTYSPTHSHYIPLLDTSYQKILGIFQICEVKKTHKSWWQFWKKRKLVSINLMCIDI